MKNNHFLKSMVILLFAIGGYNPMIPLAISQESTNSNLLKIEALRAEIQSLRVLPNQSHTMIDVEYHFSNLWFAGKNGNWPLASFYLNETRSHLNWTLRLQQFRRLSSGEQLDLLPILQGIEKTGLAQLRMAVDETDPAAFELAYEGMLDQCYSCHLASEKPYLRVHIPDMPATQLIDLEGNN